MEIRNLLIKGIRKAYRSVFRKQFQPENYILDRIKSNDRIYDLLMSGAPCMISRFGSGEIGITMNYLSVHDRNRLRSYYRYVFDDYGLPWWDKLFFKSMRNNMGIFPEKIEILERFAELMLEDSAEIDLLGAMNYTEKYMPLKDSCQKVHIESLYPFFVERPWTRALCDKKVLVIHPFVFSIKKQLVVKKHLFENPDVWPDYELHLLRAVQSNAGAEVPFADWFEALQYMKDEVEKIDFDIAIIGCGAYGLPLAAHIKRMGKKAVHLGGGSQLLFGIKGKRWDNNRYHWSYLPKDYDTNYSALYNEFWCRPNEKETPKNAVNVEGACYW